MLETVADSPCTRPRGRSTESRSARVAKGTLDIDRFRIRYRVTGEGAPTLVCVNGAQQTMGSWRSFISTFGREMQLICFDFPNVGKSDVLSGEPGVTFDEQLLVLEAVIRKLAPGTKVVLLGASWGGILTAAAAARFPELIERVLLLSFGVRANPTMLETITEGLSLVDQGRAEELGPLFVERFGSRLPEAFKKVIFAQFSAAGENSIKALYHHARFVRGTSHAREHVDLDRIAAPTLIVNGELDEILDTGDLANITREMPCAQAMIVSGAGHFLHQEEGRDHLHALYRPFLTGEMQITPGVSFVH